MTSQLHCCNIVVARLETKKRERRSDYFLIREIIKDIRETYFDER